jgi:sugar phosphate isomerase/epimerase
MSDVELACDATPWGVDGFVNALNFIRRAGFTGVEGGVELVPVFEDRIHILQEMLASENLSLVSIRTNVRELSGGRAEEESERCLNVARFLKAIECPLLILTPPPYAEETFEEEWLLFTNLLSEVSRRCEETDIKLLLNPQPGTIVGTRSELELILKSFAVKTLPLAVDAAFLGRARLSAASFFKKYKSRTGHLYLSDLAKEKKNAKKKSKSKAKAKVTRVVVAGHLVPARVSLGQGHINLDRFVDAAHAIKFSGWVSVRLPDDVASAEPDVCTEGSYSLASELFDVF